MHGTLSMRSEAHGFSAVYTQCEGKYGTRIMIGFQLYAHGKKDGSGRHPI